MRTRLGQSLQFAGKSLVCALVGRNRKVGSKLVCRTACILLTLIYIATPSAAQLPNSTGFDYPVGPPNAVGWHIAEGRDYKVGVHTAEDWNYGSGNDDLRLPVYAASTGKVMRSVFSVNSEGKGWGNVILIQSTVPNEGTVGTFYAHLDARSVGEGTIVSKGQKIGTVGKTGGQTYAHLHFEVRKSSSTELGSGYGTTAQGQVDPSDYIDAHQTLGPLVGVPAPTPHDAHFREAYARVGGEAKIGKPANHVHTWRGLYVQGYRNSAGVLTPIMDSGSYPHTAAWWMNSPIYQKYYAMNGPDSVLKRPLTDTRPAATPSRFGTSGVVSRFEGGYINSSSKGTFETHGPIYSKYVEIDASWGVLGFPMSDVMAATLSPFGTTGTVSRFENGYITSSSKGTWESHGAVATKYAALAGSGGSLGFPASDTRPGAAPSPYGSSGEVQRYEDGYIHTSQKGTWAVRGYLVAGIARRFSELNGSWGILGYPVRDDRASGPSPAGTMGRSGEFEGGFIHDSIHGVHATVGPIFVDYKALGGSGRPLGFPKSEEYVGPQSMFGTSGRVQSFELGEAYRSSLDSLASASVLYGAVRNKFNSMGGPAGLLGYPTSDAGANGRTSPQGTTGKVTDFEGGLLSETPAGIFAVYGGIHQKYTAAGGPSASYGFPIGDRYIKNGRAAQKFEGGDIVLDRPYAVADNYGLPTGSQLVAAAKGVLTNDEPGNNANAILVTPPAHAQAFSLNADGGFSYQPEPGFAGTDTFYYKASSDLGITISTRVTIRVVGLDAVATNKNAEEGGRALKGFVKLTHVAVMEQEVALTSNFWAATVPGTVKVLEGESTAGFDIPTSVVSNAAVVTIKANADGRTRTTTFQLLPGGLKGLSLSPIKLIGGSLSSGSITLSGPAPALGSVVTLSSSGPAASVPSKVTVPAGQSTVGFVVKTNPTPVDTSVTISANRNSVTKTASLTVLAPVMSGFVLSPSAMPGGRSSIGRIELSGPAGAGGFLVNLAANSPATVPLSITIPQGATFEEFAIKTVGVDAPVDVDVTATGGLSLKRVLSVLRAPLKELRLATDTTAGGTAVSARIILDGQAGPSGAVVFLSSSDPAVAVVPKSVTVEGFGTTKVFNVQAKTVATQTVVTISATYRGITRTFNLTVNP